MSQKVESKRAPMNIVTLPNELLVHIISFLTCVREVVKLRYVSRRFLSICETPSLWRELIWPLFDIREKHCVKSVLKSCGKYVRQLSFPDHVESTQLRILRHCNNLVELSIPTSTLNCNQLRKIMKHGNIAEPRYSVDK